MAMSRLLKDITKEDWRMLGYFYDKDDANGDWVLVGSPHGLQQFCRQLEEYASRPRNQVLGADDHWGPYRYLTVRTHSARELTAEHIGGKVSDLVALAELIRTRLKETSIGGQFTIRTEYCEGATSALRFEVRPHGFDPATEDAQLWQP